jgi:hypothetical protein
VTQPKAWKCPTSSAVSAGISEPPRLRTPAAAVASRTDVSALQLDRGIAWHMYTGGDVALHALAYRLCLVVGGCTV